MTAPTLIVSGSYLSRILANIGARGPGKVWPAGYWALNSCHGATVYSGPYSSLHTAMQAHPGAVHWLPAEHDGLGI